VLADSVVGGRIFHAAASPVGSPWMWTLIFDYHEDRTPTHGYEATREATMAAFAKSWALKQSHCGLMPANLITFAHFSMGQSAQKSPGMS
jgi:hypothetical protein